MCSGSSPAPSPCTVYKPYKPEADAAAEIAVDLLEGKDFKSVANDHRRQRLRHKDIPAKLLTRGLGDQGQHQGHRRQGRSVHGRRDLHRRLRQGLQGRRPRVGRLRRHRTTVTARRPSGTP